jgi:pSer/pThr/pTyr-binding forkhead associated (FHA) protein
MELFRDFIEEVSTLSAKEFLQKYPHPFLFYSETPRAIEAFAHTRLVDPVTMEENIDRFSQQVLDFIPLLPNRKSDRDFPDKAFIGRDAKRDFVIEHTTVSGRHACLMYDPADEIYRLVDSGSTNGTSVRGHSLTPGEPVTVHDGDVIRFGRLSFLFFSPKGAYRYIVQYRLFLSKMQV